MKKGLYTGALLGLLGVGLAIFLLWPHTTAKATLLQPTSGSTLSTGTYKFPETVSADAILQDVNAARQSNGVPALAADPYIAQAATDKCNDMVRNNYYGHVNPTTQAHGYQYIYVEEPYATNVSEILAGGVYTNQQYVDAWLNSPEHREAMLNPIYNVTGIATCVLPNTPSNDIIAVEELATVESGAVCGDGWRSYSTGSGTCSDHNSVKRWLP